MAIKESELILNPDGSVYHVTLRPEDIAHDIITVGDPDRVTQIARYFDTIQVKKKSREFYTITGLIGKKRLTVISTGIGTDNIDIVFNELDALVNINLETREVRSKLTKLNFYRIGTSGSIHKNIQVDSFVASSAAIGLDGLIAYYKYKRSPSEATINRNLKRQFPWLDDYPYYVAQSNPGLLRKCKKNTFTKGITVTANGFYNPQGRILRLQSPFTKRIKKLHNQFLGAFPISNLEMETAGIYGLSNLLGHRAISLNAILANRHDGTFSSQPKKTIKKLIETTLEMI